MKALVLCVLTLAGLAASLAEPVCTAPSTRGARTLADGHAKSSSFAPHSRARNRAYGAPVQRPILWKHARHKRRAGNSPPK